MAVDVLRFPFREFKRRKAELSRRGFPDSFRESCNHVQMANESLHATTTAVATDRLNNVLTGIALRCGVLETRVEDPMIKADLSELATWAKEAVSLLRQIAPSR
jgi:hypothetical protein